MEVPSRLGPKVSVGVHEGDIASTRRLERVLPTANVDIIVNLAEDEIRTYAEDGTVRRHAGAVLSGPASHARVIDTDETTNLVTVSFAHGIAGAYVHHSLHELTDELVPLGDLFGTAGATLRERLLESPASAARAGLIERLLLGAVSAPAANSVVDSALPRLGCGQPVRAVAQDLDVSPRHLERLFKEHVGMSPKRYARIRRLQRVLQSVHSETDSEWAAVAAYHGYVDQAHIIRDFGDLTGMTPTGYKAMATDAHNHVAFVQSTRAAAT